ncbi:hypothetical protein F4604DRAFT_1824791 [Suillus subluteus]|nr:hypothetical protein F4604DRAFT_1824791 [Suillus subluteus]
MKFTSLTTVIITAAAMASVDIASAAGGPDILGVPGQSGCASGYSTYNNGNDFGYKVGPNGHSQSWTPCPCKGCCNVIHAADGTTVADCVT